jgi:hypothetical protein
MIKPGPGFLMSYAMIFLMFNDLMWELFICFVDIGGIVDQHCLNFFGGNNCESVFITGCEEFYLCEW